MAKIVIKNVSKEVLAFELSASSPMERKLIDTGKIVYVGNGEYEFFSQDSQSGAGEKAHAGDYFKVDSGKLKLDPANPDQYFGAELWETLLTAASDAVLIFYSVNRDEETGRITSAEFNFVARKEFESSYHFV